MKSWQQDVKTQWKKVIDFINSLQDNEVFERKQLLMSVYKYSWKNEYYRRTYTTADNYRLLLLKTGFVKRIELGVFKKLHSVPDIPLYKIRDYAKMFTDQEWKKWFITPEQRVKRILEDYK